MKDTGKETTLVTGLDNGDVEETKEETMSVVGLDDNDNVEETKLEPVAEAPPTTEQLAFMEAVRAGNLEEVRRLLKEYPHSVNQPIDGKYAIFEALHLPQPAVFTALLDGGASVTIKQDGHLLLECLWRDAKWSDADRSGMALWLDSKDASWPHPIFRAVCLENSYNVSLEILSAREAMVWDSFNATPLHYAAASSHFPIMEECLPWLKWFLFQNVDRHFVKSGRDSFRLDLTCVQDKEGKTVLDWAIDHNQSDAVRELLSRSTRWSTEALSRTDCTPEIQGYLAKAFLLKQQAFWLVILQVFLRQSWTAEQVRLATLYQSWTAEEVWLATLCQSWAVKRAFQLAASYHSRIPEMLDRKEETPETDDDDIYELSDEKMDTDDDDGNVYWLSDKETDDAKAVQNQGEDRAPGRFSLLAAPSVVAEGRNRSLSLSSMQAQALEEQPRGRSFSF